MGNKTVVQMTVVRDNGGFPFQTIKIICKEKNSSIFYGFKSFDRVLIKAVGGNDIRIIHWVNIQSSFLAHRHYKLLAFVTSVARTSSAAFRVAGTLS